MRRLGSRPVPLLLLCAATVTWLLLPPLLPPGAPSAPGWLPPPSPPVDPASWRNLSPEQIGNLSRVGRLLFLGDEEGLVQQNKTFTILVWKHGPFLQRRHIFHFSDQRHDPFEDCSVANCRITYEDAALQSADAVLFHLHLTKGPQTLPQRDPSAGQQRWVFLADESPHNTFLFRDKGNKMKNYDGLFNWSMSYRMDSDVPVPYGRTVPLPESERGRPLRNYAQGKSAVVAIMGSNCGGVNKRWDYVRELQKHIAVDVFGKCGPHKSCPGHFLQDCPVLKKYKFYLAFENSNCQDYVTEKLWWNAYGNDAIPVIMGAPRSNLRQLLPRRSYLHVDDFGSPADLARFLLYLNSSDKDYNTYFEWKNDFKILNEHGYFKSPVFHYCRLCEALNYNDPAPKVYNNLAKFWNAEEYCHYENYKQEE